jgi:lysophospholipase L1-like esterase
MPQYFKETRTLLESIDFSKIDIVTIAYGTNDFTAGIPLDNAENEMDVNTFGGALRYSLETLMSAYPQLHIFVCTPTYRFWLDSNLEFMYDSDTHVINGEKLTDFVAKTQTISRTYHVKSIDNYYDLGINKFNRTHWFPSNDGTHHNADGGMLIAQHMANEMF